MSYKSVKQISQILKLIMFLLVISGCVWLTVWRIKKNNPSEKKPDIYLFCTECQSVYQPKERLGGEHPRVCDKCGKRAVWYAMQCIDCNEIFAFKPELDSRGQIVRRNPVCPNCGSGNYGMYNPEKK